MNRNRYLFVRIDDVCPGMNIVKFEKTLKLLDEYNIRPLLGIVPNNQDLSLNNENLISNFWEYVLDLKKKGFVVSQHGYNHVYVTDCSGILKINKRSEFAGLSYQNQYDKLKSGKKILEQNDLDTDVFMAPSHSYDKTTLKALKNLGFKYITDGYANNLYKYRGLTFIPCCHWYEIKKLKGVATLCLHPNTMTDKDFDELKKSLDQFKEYLADYSVAFTIKKVKKTRLSEIILKFKQKIKKVLYRGRR